MFTVQQTGLMVELDATQSSDADGDALTYAWSLNGEAAPTGLNVSYEFASAGEKAITLIVHDGTIYSLPSVQTITLAPSVENTAPVANFTVEVEGLTVTVNGSTSTDAESNPLTYSWDFAGEAIKTGVTSSYTFTTEGSKSISLTVNDGLLDSAAVAKVVMVEAPELDYETALNYITPFVEESCLFCHSTSPAGSAEISYGLALTPAEVKNGIVAYLTKYPDSVEKVQNKPTLETLNHGGLKPFSGSPKRENWIAAVEGIALELSGDPDVGEGEIIFTEDYENQTVNENPSGWGVNYQYNIVPNPTPTQFSDAIKVTNEFAHTGTKALYVDGRDLASAMRYSFKTLTLPNDKERVFVRYYLRSTEYIGNRAKNPDGSDPNHNHFMALENGQSDEIRIGEIKGALGVNEFGRDDIVPTAEYWYGQIETPRIEADTWYCVETAFLNDGSKPELKTWLNEELVTHIDDHTDFKNGAAVERWLDNKFGKVSLGWANYQTYDTEVYFDDVVVSTERIGCM
jgi:PKD repeat protein